jgi:hypothetical protein
LTIAEKANQTIEEEKKSPTIQYSSIPKSLSEHAKQKKCVAKYVQPKNSDL